MKVFLSTTRSPYDASIEIVLPGIQERLNGITVHIDSKLSGIEASIRGIETSIPDKVDKKLDNVVNTIRTEMAEMQATAFHAVANAITPHQQFERNLEVFSPAIIDNRNNQAAQRKTTREITENRTTENRTYPNAQLSPHFASLLLMWDEWHGDKPLQGGFDQMEKVYKSKWRKHFNAAQTRHYTRI